MHKDYEVVVTEISGNPTPEELDALNKAFDAWQEAMLEDQKNIANDLNVSLYTAGMIQYLRGRSRWTQEKEDELVRRDQTGEELPNVFTGEF